MDIMNIKSRFMTNVVSKLVKKALYKKLGYDIDLKLNNIEVNITDGQAHLHLDVNADMSKEELMKMLKNIGLD